MLSPQNGRHRMRWGQVLGQAGELAVQEELQRRGWLVRNANTRMNQANVDLIADKNGKRHHLQVKTRGEYKWIMGGSVNPIVCAGGPIYNRVQSDPLKCNFVVFLTPKSPCPKQTIPAEFLHFVMPVAAAEAAIRKNIDGYFNNNKADGSPRKKFGTCGAFVGPGPLTMKTIPEQRDDFLPYLGRYDLLEL